MNDGLTLREAVYFIGIAVTFITAVYFDWKYNLRH